MTSLKNVEDDLIRFQRKKALTFCIIVTILCQIKSENIRRSDRQNKKIKTVVPQKKKIKRNRREKQIKKEESKDEQNICNKRMRVGHETNSMMMANRSEININ